MTGHQENIWPEIIPSKQSQQFCSVLHFYDKGKGLGTHHSTAYMKQTLDKQHFTILEVAADWCELLILILQRITQLSIARASKQMDS